MFQQQFRAHLESWWTPLHSLLLRMMPWIHRMPCLGCGNPSTTFQCTAHQKHANSAPANWNHCCSGQWKSETEMPLTVENYTWSRIMTASWMQLPGTKIQVFSFPFFLTKDKYRDQASYIVVAFTPFWQHSLKPDAGIYSCPVQTLLQIRNGVKLQRCKAPEHKEKWSPYIPNITEILNFFNYMTKHYL